MYCKPRGRENTMSKDLFTISLLIAGSVSWVGAGSVSYCYEGLDQKGFWIVKALKRGRSLGGGSLYICIHIRTYTYIYMYRYTHIHIHVCTVCLYVCAYVRLDNSSYVQGS